MIAVFVLVIVVSSAPPAPPATPMREVVYKVSSLHREDLAIETYGGQVAQQNDAPVTGVGQSQPVASEPGPTAKHSASLQEGTLTVDVLGVQQDVIRVSVTENFKNSSAPVTYEAYIAPNGLVRFMTQEPSSIARYMLPLFGTKFAASSTLNAGDSWHVDLKTDVVDVQNIFTISGKDGNVLLLDEREIVKLNAAHGMNYNTYGKLKYKPSLLVPIAGDINEKGSRSTMDTVDTLTTTVHFERVSDTLDISTRLRNTAVVTTKK
jgi:hypothetical protein